MNDNTYGDLERLCTGLVDDLDNSLQWSWEDRFRAALTQFSADDEGSIQKLLTKHFGTVWESSNIAEADGLVRKLCNDYGGIRPGQLLFSSDAEQDTILLGLWWPWGNGKTISIRILPTAADLPEPEMNALIERFKTWFGI